MPTKIPFGNFGGIMIRVHWTTFVAILGTALSLLFLPIIGENTTISIVENWLVVFGVGVALYGSLLLHGLGHAFTARGLGLQPFNTILFPFGEISNLHEQTDSIVHEGVVAATGPIINLILGMIFSVAGAMSPGLSPIDKTALEFLGAANLLLALVNFFPGLPLDGGRLLRSLVWFLNGKREQGTKFALAIGLFAPWLIMAGGIALSLSYLPAGLWFFSTGLLTGFVCGKRYQREVREEENIAAR